MARVLYYLSFLVITVTTVIAGVRIWRDAHRRPDAVPVWVGLVPEGTLELAADRHTLRRAGTTTWAVTVAAIDDLEVAGDLVLAFSSSSVAVLSVNDGRQQFSWAMPSNERWLPSRMQRTGSCLLTLTARLGDAVVRCLARDGVVRWRAIIDGGRDCRDRPVAIGEAVVVPCAGWLSVIDRDGKVTPDAGGLTMVNHDPPILLRVDKTLTIAEWDPREARFASPGRAVGGLTDFLTGSAVLRGQRLLVRASSASSSLAVVADLQGSKSPTVIAAASVLADDTPLVVTCDSGTPPRFQLIKLRPASRAGHANPTSQIGYGLIDLEQGQVSWSSTMFEPASSSAASLICVHGNYFVPIDARLGDEVVSRVWIVDAEHGTTTHVVAGRQGTSFANLRADQVDGDRLVGLGVDGIDLVSWRAKSPPDDAIVRVLGTLP